jgi:hypothetical protein
VPTGAFGSPVPGNLGAGILSAAQPLAASSAAAVNADSNGLMQGMGKFSTDEV